MQQLLLRKLRMGTIAVKRVAAAYSKKKKKLWK
jgi:hypothetical protein